MLGEVKSFRTRSSSASVRARAGADGAGAGRRRAGGAEAVDRGPARRAQAAARLDQGARSPASRRPSGSASSGSPRRRGHGSRRTQQRQGSVDAAGRRRAFGAPAVQEVLAPAPAVPVRRRRRHRDAVPRRPVRLGRCQPVRLRLLRLRHVRLRPDRRLAAASRGVAVRHGHARLAATQLEAGDLVFFNGLGHVGIYIGGGQFIHAPHTGDVVKISSLSDSWYASTWVGARRF